MSGGGGGGGVSRGNGAAAAAAAGIPSGAKKMVQSLKEIVNLPDQEIYATLKECSMDPSEAVQRLLSQDSFHEVKSKRDKKKEMRDTLDSRSRTSNNSSSRGGRGGSDRGHRTSSIQSSSSDYGGSRVKPVAKKENGISTASSSLNSVSSSYGNRSSTVVSEATSAENLMLLTGVTDGSNLLSQPPSGHQHNWGGMPGQVSMADVVKMGRPQSKHSATSVAGGNSSHVLHNQIQSSMTKQSYKQSAAPFLPSELDHGIHSSQDPQQQVEDISYERGSAWNDHDPSVGWPNLSQPITATVTVFVDPSGTVTSCSETSALVVDDVHLHQTLHEVEIPESDETAIYESFPEESLRSESVSERKILLDTSEDVSDLDDESMKNAGAYMSQSHPFEQYDGEVVNAEISSAATSLQNLSLQKEGLSSPSLEDNPAVIIPRHLKVTNADCSHLSFGSFGSGSSTSFPGSFQSKPLQSNAEVTKVVDDLPSHDNSDARITNYENDQLKSQRNEDAISRGGMSTINYDMPSTSEAEVIRNDAVDTSRGLQYNFPLISGYGTSASTEHDVTSFGHPPSNSQMQNLDSLSTLMQPYSNSLPSSLLPPAIQPLRDLELPFSSLLSTQSASTKYGAPTSSVTGQSISMPEIKPSVFSNPSTTQSSSNTSIPPGLAVPQHLPVHPYSQAALSLGPFANMISYPFLPQSYPYLPSAAFPQAYTSNVPFHQSPTVHNTGLKYTLPQYKNNISVSSLPTPAAIASGYGNFASSTNIPGNFSLNSSTTPTTTTLGFDEALNSQYKEGTHYLSSQQNESSPLWVHGGSSRTVSPLSPNTFYGFQGQNQLSSFRQAQQPSHYGAMGYLNFYQNQLGGPNQEHQQNPSEASSNGSQGNPSQQSHQIWQHGY
ncbi:hypothetical protein AXF42_Ash017161 [Apostasia shenzhenica]|uniref:GBF-interacting protein 1 N-terminal domain-containing protein n=1 Tax=Apostasia shenzhenica TaxID=1088818 RepID=A0A2H9ZVC8_9ASPA|nr:hypothetical protein AXF42_Ash017161 [Apostasia shenzhenica]